MQCDLDLLSRRLSLTHLQFVFLFTVTWALASYSSVLATVMSLFQINGNEGQMHMETACGVQVNFISVYWTLREIFK